jgi:S1-C subfamily serine protease
MTAHRAILFATAALAASIAGGGRSAAAADALADSVLAVEATCQTYDTFQPWQKDRPALRRGYAVAIGPRHLVTTESLVRNHTLVELRRADSGARIPATVELADYQVNLALLSVDAAAGAPRLKPLAFAPSLARRPALQILQFDESSQVQRGDARLVRAAMQRLPNSPHLALNFVLLTDLNVNGEGAPVVEDGRIAAMVGAYDRGARTAAALPFPVLTRFAELAAQASYPGFAVAGFQWTPLVDPAKRAYLGVTAPERGVLVLGCLTGTGAAETLRPGDAILSWDGVSVDSMGFYDDPRFGRLSFPYLIQGQRRPDDQVRVRTVREGRETNLVLRLSAYRDENALVPENVVGAPEPYLVVGGLLIRELTGAYLRAHGNDWSRRVDSRLTHLYLTRKTEPEQPGDRVVLLAAVLPDALNVGYQNFRNEIVTRVNGQPVRNLRDVFRIEKDDGALRSFSLQGMGVDLVLDPKRIPEADARIAAAYNITALRRQPNGRSVAVPTDEDCPPPPAGGRAKPR